MSSSKTSMAGKPGLGPVDLSRMRRAPTHPGVIFSEEWLQPQPYGAQSRAARALGMSVNSMNLICSGQRPVTPTTAVLIGRLTGTSPQMWAHMQADYDVWHAMQTVKVRIDPQSWKTAKPRAPRATAAAR